MKTRGFWKSGPVNIMADRQNHAENAFRLSDSGSGRILARTLHGGRIGYKGAEFYFLNPVVLDFEKHHRHGIVLVAHSQPDARLPVLGIKCFLLKRNKSRIQPLREK